MAVSMIRAFIALDLSDEILQHLDRVSKELQQRIPQKAVRWVPAQNIHLTLKFLGDVSEKHLVMITNAIKAEAAAYTPFTISVGGLGAFPKIANPRVIWVGVEAPEALAGMQRSLELQMERLGYAREDRRFSAHLTIGRVSRTVSSQQVRLLSEVLGSYSLGFIGMVKIEALYLYRSDLRPDGAVYSRLFSAPLAA